ncbi:MAG: ATP-binding protein, partial [Anaerolineae bacterium]|nr:ATP-binding protein [Anaerolineae bacterium]
TGVGIDPADMPHIFDFFYRADQARSIESGGIGLGLSIVKMVAEAYGGEILVRSQPGEGSVFTLSFPVNVAYHDLVSFQ